MPAVKLMMMKAILSFVGIACLVISCAPSTPDSRIAARPEIYQSLSGTEQSLVRQGLVRRGMSRDAVRLAWGEPSQKIIGAEGRVEKERWDYAGNRPSFESQFYSGFGYGDYGHPYRRSRYGMIGVGYGPDVTYVPYLKASVTFANQRVESWQRAMGNRDD